MPRSSSPLFTGRVTVLSELSKQLLPDPNVKIQPSHRISVLQGMGGSGKSEVALRFAEANRDKYVQVIIQSNLVLLTFQGSGPCFGSMPIQK